MKTNRLSKWKVLLTALFFSAAMIPTQPRTAHAYCFDPYSCGAIVGLVITFATVKATICTTVATINSQDHVDGFGGAFKDCWNSHRDTKDPASMQSSGPQVAFDDEETESSGDQD